MQRVTTESGAVYEFEDGKVRRVNPNAGMRRDGEWLELQSGTEPCIGKSMRLCLEPLSDVAVMTFRTTTPVVSIE